MNTQEKLAKNAAYMRDWLAKNKDYANAQRRERRKKDPEKYRKTAREWLLENKDKVKSWNIHLDPEKAKARQKRWEEKNYEKVLVKGHNYRARRRNAKGTISGDEWKSLCEKYDNKCLRCGKQGRMTLDHVIPLSLGGENTIDNAQPLCHSCNSGKGARHIDYRK
jgi:5-methylcytosine-specific restriction endonuclease McrA